MPAVWALFFLLRIHRYQTHQNEKRREYYLSTLVLVWGALCATIQMRIRIPPLLRRRPTAPTDQNISFTVEQAFAGDLGPCWTGDAADWPVEYKLYTSENAFCEALKAKATTDIVTTPNGIVGHTFTFQPYTKTTSAGNEDRHTVLYWEFPSGQWTFVGVFDGM